MKEATLTLIKVIILLATALILTVVIMLNVPERGGSQGVFSFLDPPLPGIGLEDEHEIGPVRREGRDRPLRTIDTNE